MINIVDKLIVRILLKVASILTNYSKVVGNYDLYEITKQIDELSVVSEVDKVEMSDYDDDRK